ncbi:MAG: sigma-70 family RNA polymerase sigma factor [Isosphaeraceae bacterium]
MGPDQASALDLLRAARDGDSEALGVLLERQRPKLLSAADRKLRRRITARIDALDIVQQTFLEAARSFATFLGRTEDELSAWLRSILDNRVATAVRDHAQLQKRDVRRERSIDQPVPSSDTRDAAPQDFDAGLTSPSRRAIRSEEADALLRALATLPEDQREAVRLRHLENRSLAEIADRLGRSRDATAGLIKRGVKTLRERLADLSRPSS